MKKALSAALFALSVSGLFAQEAAHFRNPVIAGDLADPSVIRMGDTYYATATSSEWAPVYPVFTSEDLVNWTQAGHVFKEKPAWTSGSFWAPELFAHKGTVYCYYTARRAADNVSYIGVATAKSPADGFTDHGPIIEYGTEAIDAFIFDDGGQLYISWKAYGLDPRPIELLACKLSDNGLDLAGEPFTLLTDDENIGIEGQYHFKKGDYYYMIYSARICCGPGSNYEVHAARSRNFEGPYEKYEGNPILYGGAGDYTACGHGTAVETPDGRMFYLCHAYFRDEGFYAGRQNVIQEMRVNDDGWVEFTTGRVACAEQPLPFPGTVQRPPQDFYDDFRGKELRLDWSWNYPYSDIEASLKKGTLTLCGTPRGAAASGTALCLRAQTTAYSFETQVVNVNDSFKGLTMYGDDGNLVMWGTAGGKLYLKSVADGKETLIRSLDAGGGACYLKIEVREGRMLDFLYGTDGMQWTKANDVPFDAGFAVRWDRVARPGLIHAGGKDAPARFSYFSMTASKNPQQ